MAESLDAIANQAMQLDGEERAKLAELLFASIRAPITEIEDAWAREIEHRVSDFDEGKVRVYPAVEVFAQARKLS